MAKIMQQLANNSLRFHAVILDPKISDPSCSLTLGDYMTQKFIGYLGFMLLGLAVSSTCASAHIVMQEMQARAGYQEVLTLLVPHGCGPEPTTEIRLKMPPEIAIALPESKPGWSTEIVYRELDQPLMLEGVPFDQVIDEVVWRGGPLPGNELGRFVFLARLPDTPGARVFFKTIQVCGDTQDAWIETIADDQETFRIWLNERPSPFVELAVPERPQLGITMQELRALQLEERTNDGE